MAHERRAGDATSLGQVGARIGFADGRLTLLGTCLRSAVSTMICRSAISASPVRRRVARGKGLDSPFVDDVEALVGWDRFADDLDRGVDNRTDGRLRGPVFIHMLAQVRAPATVVQHQLLSSARAPMERGVKKGGLAPSGTTRQPHWPSGVLPSRTEVAAIQPLACRTPAACALGLMTPSAPRDHAPVENAPPGGCAEASPAASLRAPRHGW